MARKVLAEFDAIDGPFNAKVRLIEQGVARFEKGTLAGFSRVEKGLDSLLGYAARLRNVSYLVAGGLGASQFTQFIDTSIRIRNELRGIGEDSNANFQKVYLAATRSLAPIDAFTSAVLRTQKVMGDKQSFDQTVRQVETLTKLLAVSGKSEAERASTLLQFTQALQAGALQGDEMRALRENAPVEFLRAIAKAAGGTLADLKKFSQEGVITTEVMIRALDSLAATADARIGKVTLTIGDAVNVLRNGAIVAAEAFNGGSGLSSAVVGTLSEVGNILGQSADALHMFGVAAKWAAIAFGTAFAGRKLQETGAGLSSLYATVIKGDSAWAAHTAAIDEVVAARRALDSATAVSVAKQTALATAQAKAGISAKSLATAQRSAASAQQAVWLATDRLTAAESAATVATGRLALASRATAGAMGVLKSAMAFMGGWPGLFLILGTAMLSAGSSAETAAEKFDRLATQGTGARDMIDQIADAQSRLNEAIENGGHASTAATDTIVANTTRELNAKKALLAVEAAKLKALQAERQIELNRLSAAMAAVPSAQSRVPDILQSNLGENAAFASAQDQADALAQATREYNAELDASTLKLREMKAIYDLDQGALEDMQRILGESAGQMDRVGAATTSAKDSAIALVDELGAAKSVMDGMASVDLASPIQKAWEKAKGLAAALWSAAGAQIAADAKSNMNFSDYAGPMHDVRSPYGSIPSGLGTAPVTPDTTPSGGGGSSEKSAQQEALDFIKEMMTAEEQRAAKLTELLALRQRLVESYGPEAQAVADLDAAIQRYRDSADEAAQAQQQLFDDLSNQLANAITDWTNFGDVVRHILASLVQSYGPDFFTALLTPGKQTGDSTGTWLGNMLTGQNHSGGGFGTQNARSISPMAFMGAPRFHNGLMPDEFTAILQKGETVLPKGFSPAGGGVSINMPIDMRGADPSMRPFIEGQIAQLKKELPGRVVSAVKSAQKSRSL